MGPLSDDVRRFCSRHGLRPDTALGQHFLIDEAVLRTIVETADIRPGDHVVEIGPGIGALTRELLKKAGKVTAIELDGKLIPLLGEFLMANIARSATTGQTTPPTVFPYTNIWKHSPDGEIRKMLSSRKKRDRSTLTLIHGNALHVPFPKEPYQIVANIPYHITSPLLRHAFLESETHPTTMTLMIQREVAEKICQATAQIPCEPASPAGRRSGPKGGERDYGLLTILAGLFGRPTLVRIVPPEAFLPKPGVDSAVVHMECFEKPLAGAETLEEVFRLTKIAFGQKRKMLRNTVGSLERGRERLERAGIDPTRRPQTLSIEEWIRMARHGLAKNT